jgi:hypothetical protein
MRMAWRNVEGDRMGEKSSPTSSSNEDPRIEVVEKDVKKLKTDVENFMTLKNTVEDLKNTIVDIRSLISESQNPFNLLQFITSEEELNKLVQAKPIVESKLSVKNKKGGRVDGKLEAKVSPEVQVPAGSEPKNADEEAGFAVETQVEVKDDATIPETCEPEKPENKFSENDRVGKTGGDGKIMENLPEALSSMSKGNSIVQWVYTMLDLGFDEKSIRKLCDYCEFSDFIPRGYSDHISNLVGAVSKARSQNLSAEEVMLSIWGAADATGAKLDFQDVSALIIHVLKKHKKVRVLKRHRKGEQ